MRALLLLLLATVTGCSAHRAGGTLPTFNRLAELDRMHGFQDLEFNRPCADQVTVPTIGQMTDHGLEVTRLQRTARVGPRVRGSLSVGCYEDMLGMVTVTIHTSADVRRTWTELYAVYGSPTSTSGAVRATWRGERVEVTMAMSPEEGTAELSYRSLLTEALWRRDVAATRSRPKLDPPDPHPTVFRLSEDGIY